jgi:hypothetical protein
MAAGWTMSAGSSLWLTILVLTCMLCDVDYRQWRLWTQVHGRSHSFDLFLPARFAAILLVYPKYIQELHHLRHAVGHLLANMSHTIRKHNSRRSAAYMSPNLLSSLQALLPIQTATDTQGVEFFPTTVNEVYDAMTAIARHNDGSSPCPIK